MTHVDDGVVAQPRLTAPGPHDHKYTRGFVTVIGGAMPGAAALATLASARAGAGYVQLIARDRIESLPFAVVQRPATDATSTIALLADERIGAVVVGMGLGRDDAARAIVAAVLASSRSLVLDADALTSVSWPLAVPVILTPHAGEFAKLFPDLASDAAHAKGRHDAVLAAARRANATVVLKGSDTVVAAPDGRAAIAPPGSHDLATAGTGDVLAGVCGTMLAQLGDPFAAACAAVWLHAAASRAIPAPFIADDLTGGLAAVVSRCR